MELHHLQTALRVMNLTAPSGMVWCAWRQDMDFAYNLKEMGGTAEIRFYLVPEYSDMVTGDGIVTA